MRRTLRVVPARPEDAGRLGAFLLTAFDEAGTGALGWTGATPETIRSMAEPRFLQGLLARPGARLFLAEQDGAVVGFAALRELGTWEVELAGVIVRESRTGAGVGTALVDAVIESARAAGMRRVTVKTEAANERARAFYRYCGFLEEAQLTEDVEGTPVDLVLLRLALTP